MKKISIVLFAFLIIFGSCTKNIDPINDNPTDSIPDDNDNDVCATFVDLSTLTSQVRIIDFINKTEGWIVGQATDNMSKRVLLHTTDGGQNWASINSDLNMQDSNVPFSFLKFINATDGYMIRKNNPYSREIKYTTDKGATWTVIPNPTEQTYNWKAFASNSSETVFISNLNFVIISNTSHEITKIIPLPDGYNFMINSDVHFSESGVITTIANKVSSGYQILRLTNYETWSNTPINIEYTYSMDFPTDNTGYIYGVNGDENYIIKTTDGGVTWTQKLFPQSLTQISFADANNGLGISYDNIFKTTDGGDTWTKVSGTCFETNEKLFPGISISYPSINLGFAAALYQKDSNTTNAGIYIYK